MKKKIKNTWPLLLLIAICLCISYFLLSWALQAVSAKRVRAASALRPAAMEAPLFSPSSIQPIAAESAPPVLDSAGEPLPASIADYTDAAVQEAYAVSGLYQDLYDALYYGGGLILTENESAQIMERLGQAGYAAADINGRVSMANPEQLRDFLSSVEAGTDGRLSLYEICLDAGFICHTLHVCEGKTYLTRTRLAWLERPGSGLQGSTATVTYSNSFKLTGLYADDGYLYYDYDVPNNPPGSNHDGHIDTVTKIYIGG